MKLNSNVVLKEYLDADAFEGTNIMHFPNLWLPTAQFSLVVFLCMSSSCSHLACILVLREYMEDHQSAGRLRIRLIIVFAAFLAVTVALASSVTPYFMWIVAEPVSSAMDDKQLPDWALSLIVALCIAIPLLVVLAIFWLCTLQLMPRLKLRIQEKLRSILLSRLRRWFQLIKIWHLGLVKALPERRRQPFTNFTKRCFWFLVLGNELAVFMLQILLALLSIVWIGLQRLSLPPDYYGSEILCSLHHIAPNSEWASFGQLLPIILLLLPMLSAYGHYVGKILDADTEAHLVDITLAEERDHKHKSISQYNFTYAPLQVHIPRSSPTQSSPR